MYIKENKNFKVMMLGGYGKFTKYELWIILCNQNELGINTLYVQKYVGEEFVCKVDELTVKNYNP